MKSVSVVIGSNYGDEGKGLVTDFLASRSSKSLVVRFNGGAQAGHTVVSRHNKQHVFHHFGSGTFAGAATFLSKFFVINPIYFIQEHRTLQELGYTPRVYVDLRCPITTPYDIMLNQTLEDTRGNNRHGSCGMGFNETLQRNLNPKYTLTFSDLYLGEVADKLNLIRREYAPMRSEELNIPKSEFFNNDEILKKYLTELSFLKKNVIFSKWGLDYLELSNTDIIFEGAQGLALDMDSSDFPYVTRSKTGINNVLDLLGDCNFIGDFTTYYLSRTYFTKHGNGPFPNELAKLPYTKVNDTTNISNKYQGSLRFAYLDMDALIGRILKDRCGVRESTFQLVLTCADQLDDGKIKYYDNNVLKEKKLSYFIANIEDRLGIGNSLISHGPTRLDLLRCGYI